MRRRAGCVMFATATVLLVAASMVLASWPGTNGPLDGSRALPTPTARAVPLGGYTADLILDARADVPAGELLTGDLDGDGRNELIVWYRDRETGEYLLTALDTDLSQMWQVRYPPQPRQYPPLVSDVDDDGCAEIVCATWGHGERADSGVTAAWLVVLDGDGRQQWKWTAPPLPEERRAVDMVLEAKLAADLDRDGRAELCLFFDSGFRRQLWLLRHDADEVHAVADLGPVADRIAVADLTGDDALELIVGGYSQSNGLQAHGVDDTQCRVIALDCRLEYLWITEPLGGTFMRAVPAARSRERGRRALLAVGLQANLGARTDSGGLLTIDPASGRILNRHDCERSVPTVALADFTRTPGTELAAFTHLGDLLVWERAGSTLAPHGRYPGERATLGFAADMDGDGFAELVSQHGAGKLRITDLSCFPAGATLSTRCVPPGAAPAVPGRIIPWDAGGDGTLEVVAAWQDNGLEVYRAVPAGPVAAGPERRYESVADLTSFEISPDGCAAICVAASGRAALHDWDGGPGREIVELPDLRAAAFSRSGAHLAVIRGGEVVERPAVAAVTAAPVQPRVAVEEGQVAAARVTHAAGRQVFQEAELALINVATGERSAVDTADLAPQIAWGADAKLRVSRLSGDSMDLWCYDPGTGAGEPVPGADHPVLDEVWPTMPGDSNTLVFARWELMRLPFIQGGMVVPRLHALRPGEVRSTVLTTDEALARALHDPRTKAPAGFLRTLAMEREHRVPEFISLRGCRSSHFLVGQMVARGIDVASNRTNIYSVPRDIWLLSARTGEMHAVTFDDDHAETSPVLSPDGGWIAFETTSAAEEQPETRIAVSNLTGTSRLEVCAGTCPHWSPTEPGLLWFLREGALHSVRLHNERPPRPPLTATALLGLGGGAGVVLTALLAALRVPARVRLLLGAWLIALQMGRTRGRSLLMVSLIRRLDDLHSSIHALKNTVMLMPTYDDAGREDPVAALGYVLDEENLGAVRREADQLLAHIDALRRERNRNRVLVADLPGELADGLRTCLDVLVASRDLLEGYTGAVLAEGADFTAAIAAGAEPDEALCDRAAADLAAFYELLTDEQERTGLMDRVRDCLEMLQVKMVLEDAAATTASRAEASGASVEVASAISPTLYIPGDPGPMQRVICDTIANSLDAIVRERSARPEHRGEVRLAAEELEDRVRITVSDNGCGLDPDLLSGLNAGMGGTTGGHTRGGGFIAAIRTLERYPGGAIRIDSDGQGTGATITITFERI